MRGQTCYPPLIKLASWITNKAISLFSICIGTNGVCIIDSCLITVDLSFVEQFMYAPAEQGYTEVDLSR